MARSFDEERERSRKLATSIVSFAIMAVGAAFLVLAVLLPVRGGLGFLFVSVILAALGLVTLAGGFFFHLVPSRLEKLAEEKRDFDRREREAAREKDKRLGRQ